METKFPYNLYEKFKSRTMINILPYRTTSHVINIGYYPGSHMTGSIRLMKLVHYFISINI